jgi:hypothetical protein
VNRVDGGIDGRHRSICNPPLDAVLAEFLSLFEQRLNRRRFSLPAPI